MKYRRVRRHRSETTVIDGVPSTRRVPYDDWEPVPPREWDDLVLRGITAVAVGFTGIAVAGGTASLGGLLSPLVPAVIAYAMGSVFAIAWMFCLGIEWLNRTAPDRARAARVAGWFFLLLSMGAVAAYGHTRHALWAGGFGACVDLVAKGSWWLLLREHAVPLDAGVAHWVTEQEQKLAGRALLAGRVRRLDRRAAYQQAIGGASYQAASAILSSAQTTALPVAPREQAPAAEPEPAPTAPPVPPAEPAAPPRATADPVIPPEVSQEPPAPKASTEIQPVKPEPQPQPQPRPESTPDPTAPPLYAVGGPFKSDTIRAALAENPTITDGDLIALVNRKHGEDRKNDSSVPRLRRRIETKTKKKKAS
ncbi:hypothetical protein ACWCQE_27740 [Streptomyces sp. NPDC002409]